MIEFGEWLPDIADYNNPGATEAKNVVPTIDGYKQFNSFTRTETALNSECRGGFAAQAFSNIGYNYAGSATKLYQLSDGTWTDQSKAGGTYSLLAGESWEFTKWGEQIIAVGGINSGTPIPPQVITMGAVGSTEFADLGGSPPQARHIATVKDFVVLGNLYESATDYPSRVRWSGVNDETIWTTNKARQADYQDLPGQGGWVQKIVGGDYGLIIMERGIVRMDYIGPPLVFSFNRILPELGTSAVNSVVQWGDLVFLLGPTGFKGIANGRERLDLGDNKINRWFFDNVDLSYAYRIVGALDRINNRILWIFPDNNATLGVANNGIVFDIATQKWSRFEENLDWIYSAYGITFTLDGLDSVSTNIDTLGASLDSSTWVSGIIGLGAFDNSHFGGRFEGSAAEAVLETTEQRLSANRKTFIKRIRPEIECDGTVALRVGGRDCLGDDVTWGSDLTQERDNNWSARSNNRYHRFRATITGGFDRAQGIVIVDGKRGGV